MFKIQVHDRARRTVGEDSRGNPVPVIDKSPMTVEYVNEDAAKVDAKDLLPELHDAPDASVTLPDGSSHTLHEWLVKNGVIKAD